jgi:AraC-like DNA-binding protein
MTNSGDGEQRDFLGAEGLAVLKSVTPLTEEAAFGLRMKSVVAGPATISYLATTPCRFEGLRQVLGVEGLQLLLPFDREILVDDHSEGAVEPGGMIVYREDNPPTLRIDEAGRFMVVTIGPGEPVGRLFSMESPYVKSSTSPSISVIRAVAEVLFRASERDGGAIGVFSMVCRMVLTEVYIASAAESKEARLIADAHQAIVRSFRNHEFTAQWLADSLGVSLRMLQRAFANGGGIAHTVRAYRTQEALRLLGARGSNELTLSAIARESGFSDVRTMRKAITDSVGMLPRDYRRHFA